MEKIVVEAPAKINLMLNIAGSSPAGYHYMDMVMQTVDWCDTVTVSITEKRDITVTCSRDDLPQGKSNIAYRAAETFMEQWGADKFGLHIHIEKNIPAQAGLGGGSSDAAAVLVGLNRLADTGISIEELCRMGNEIGKDIPFCITGGCGLVEGFGEIISPLPSLPICRFLIVKPTAGADTRQAFGAYDALEQKPASKGSRQMVHAIKSGDIWAIAAAMENVFEAVADIKRVSAIKQWMLDLGALGAVMSGSGSAVVGLFEECPDLNQAIDNHPEGLESICVTSPVSHGSRIISEN